MNSDNPVEKNSVVSSHRWLFVLARVYLGISFLFSDHGNARPSELAGFLKFALKNGYGWYQNLLNSFVLEHSSTFGSFVVIAEIYIGIALVLGFTTRLAALVALFFALKLYVRQRCCALGSGHRSVGYHSCTYHPSERRGPYVWPGQVNRQAFPKGVGFVNGCQFAAILFI